MSEEFEGLVKLTGLWKQKDKEGKTYYSGGLTYSTNILLFPNSYKKEGDKQPDLNLFICKKKKKEEKPKFQDSEDPGGDEVPF